jgi:hypothetical protein
MIRKLLKDHSVELLPEKGEGINCKKYLIRLFIMFNLQPRLWSFGMMSSLLLVMIMVKLGLLINKVSRNYIRCKLVRK